MSSPHGSLTSSQRELLRAFDQTDPEVQTSIVALVCGLASKTSSTRPERARTFARIAARLCRGSAQELSSARPADTFSFVDRRPQLRLVPRGDGA